MGWYTIIPDMYFLSLGYVFGPLKGANRANIKNKWGQEQKIANSEARNDFAVL